MKSTEKDQASREAALFKREERARNLKLKLTEQAMTIKAEKILKRLKNTNPNNLTQMLAAELETQNSKRSRLNSNSTLEITQYNSTT